jgi:hypothetical protein
LVLGSTCDLVLRDARPPLSGKPEIGALTPQDEVATISALILRSHAKRGVSKDGRELVSRLFETRKLR